MGAAAIRQNERSRNQKVVHAIILILSEVDSSSCMLASRYVRFSPVFQSRAVAPLNATSGLLPRGRSTFCYRLPISFLSQSDSIVVLSMCRFRPMRMAIKPKIEAKNPIAAGGRTVRRDVLSTPVVLIVLMMDRDIAAAPSSSMGDDERRSLSDTLRANRQPA